MPADDPANPVGRTRLRDRHLHTPVDGIADLPQSPLNLVSDLAFMGYFSVHDPMMTPDQIAHAVPLPTSPDYPGDTQYYDTQ